MNSDKFFSLFGKIVAVLTIVTIVALAGYFLGIKNKKPSGITAQQTTQNLESPITTQTSKSPLPPPSPSPEPTLAVLIKQALVTKHGSDFENVNITVGKTSGDYASGTVNAQGGGGMWFAAKVSGVWKIVADGNGSIMCSNLKPYPNFPANMIPECWDDQTQKLVTR